MKTIWILLSLVIFTGCVTHKRCLRKFPPQTVIERSDSIIFRDTIIYRDRIIRDSIPADTVFIEKIVPVDLNIAPIEAENRYAKARAWLEDQKLKLQLTQREQVIQRILKNAEKQEKYWMYKYQNERITETVTVFKTKPIHKTAMIFSLIVILLFILYVVNRFKKFLPF